MELFSQNFCEIYKNIQIFFPAMLYFSITNVLKCNVKFLRRTKFILSKCKSFPMKCEVFLGKRKGFAFWEHDVCWLNAKVLHWNQVSMRETKPLYQHA